MSIISNIMSTIILIVQILEFYIMPYVLQSIEIFKKIYEIGSQLFDIFLKSVKFIICTIKLYLTKSYYFIQKNLKQQLLDLLADEDLRLSLNGMFTNQLDRLITDEKLSTRLRELAIKNGKTLSEDPEMKACITEVIQTQLESTNTSERTKVAIANLLKQHIEEMVEQEWFVKNVEEQIIQIVKVTCESEEIKAKIRSLIENVADGLAKSDDTNKIINDFLLKIVNDKEFMKQSGTAVRRSLKHAAYGLFWNYERPKQDDNSLNDDNRSVHSVDSIGSDYTHIEIKKNK